MLNFNNRVAIVTGAGRGVGRAHALALGTRGCRVVVNDLPGASSDEKGPAHEVVAEIVAAGGDAMVNEDSVLKNAAAIVQSAIDQFGQLDILINNAGTTAHGFFEGLSEESFWGQVDMHLKAGVDLCRAAWPHLKASETGRIVNTISSGIFGNAAISNYTAGKGGLLGFTRSIGLEGEIHGIYVNGVFPNAATRMQADMAEALQPILKRHYRPERIADFVAWLVHQDTTVRNQMFEVGGGLIGRLSYAHYPFVRNDGDGPEGWAQVADAVMADGPLRPLPNTITVLERELEVLEPDLKIDLSKVLQGE